MRDQRIVGAVADVGLLREHRLHAALLRHLADMRRIVDAGGIEGARDHRHFQLHIGQPVRLAGRGVRRPRARR